MWKYPLYRCAIELAKLLPTTWSLRLGMFIGFISYYFDSRRRNLVRKNLSIVCAKVVNEAQVKEVFKNFGRYLSEFLLPIDKRYRLLSSAEKSSMEYMSDAYRAGNGVLGLTAHLGNWEMAALMTAGLGCVIRAVFYTHPDKGVDRLFLKQRCVKNLSVVSWKDNAMKECIDALRQGHLVAIAGDVDFQGTGFDVLMFGRKTKIPRGPLVLARRIGCPIVFGTYVWSEQGAYVFYEKPILTQGKMEADIARDIVSVLEKWIRKYPTQWFCFEDIWKD